MGYDRVSRKVLYISGTRADYGLMRSVLRCIHDHPDLSLEIAATGMHLMDEFGTTLNEIEKDNFPFSRIEAVIEGDDKSSMSRFIGTAIQKLTDYIEKSRPNIILVLGDRGEMLAGAVVGTYLGIPVAHIHGGEITSTVDDITRHAITKLSHIHFPTTNESAERIIRMGENPACVFVVGAPGLDQVLSEKPISKTDISKKYSLVPENPFFLVVQHPVSLEVEDSGIQMHETLEAVVALHQQTIIVYPNADAGGRKMIDVIHEYESDPLIHTFKSIPHIDYISLLREASALIGNSSSGIIEAPSLGTPVVNIGSRQQGRQRGDNVIDVGYDQNEIIAAVRKTMDDSDFIRRVKLCRNPYRNGNCSRKIADVLSTIPLDNSLIQKRITY